MVTKYAQNWAANFYKEYTGTDSGMLLATW